MTNYEFGSGYSHARWLRLPVCGIAGAFIKMLPGHRKDLNPVSRKWLRAMKLTALLLTVTFLNVYAGGSAQSVTYSGRNVPLKSVLNAIEKQTGYVVFANAGFFSSARQISVDARQMPLTEFLEKITEDQPFTFQVSNRTISLVWREVKPEWRIVEISPPQQHITGKVMNSKQEPLAGATVLLKKANRAVTTNGSGEFSIAVENMNDVLNVSFVGYVSTEVDLRFWRDKTLRVMLQQDAQQLGNVTVVSTGYQLLPKDRATGSFSTISNKDLENRTSRDLNTLMEGLAPGFTIQYQGVGMDNDDPQVMMRGVSTFGNTQPLIVVDGFPIEGKINTINPNDVASITFLRDAAAAAIWGVKASNGVIVIQTKKGNSIATKVAFRSNFTVTEKPDLSYLHLLGSEDMVDLEKEMFGKSPSLRDDYQYTWAGTYSPVVDVLMDHADGKIDDAERDRRLAAIGGHDNRKDASDVFFGTNYVQDNTLSFSGAPSSFMNYYASLGYTNSSGLYRGDGRRHTNANFNTELKVTPKLKVLLGLNYSDANIDRSSSKAFSSLGVDIPYILRLLPYERFYQADGSPAKFARRYSPEVNTALTGMGYYDAGYYPANDWKFYDYQQKENSLRLQTTASYKINKTFTFQGGFKTETGNSLSSELNQEQSYYVRSMLNRFAAPNASGKLVFNLPKGDILSESSGRVNNFYVRGQLDMDHSFKNHPGRINALIGTEWQKTQQISSTDTRFGYGSSSGLSFPVDQNALLNFYNTQFEETVNFEFSNFYNKSLADDRYVSYYFSGAYEYDQRYAISASARINKSSRFDASAGLNKELLGSLGAKWNLHHEKFLEKAKWINTLSLRITTGLTGNVPGFTHSPYHTSAYNALSTYTNSFTLTVLNPYNKKLKWESSLTQNLGVDFSFLNGRISGMLDLYHKKTVDLLGVQSMDPTIVGRMLVTQNVADMVNKGIELQLNTVNLKSKDWVWRTTLNASYNKNTVKKVTGNYGVIVQRVAQVQGYTANSLFAYRWAGLSDKGYGQFYDNKNGKDEIVGAVGGLTLEDLKHVGSITPVYTAGLMNAVGYKGLELSFLFVTSGGHYLQTDSYTDGIFTQDFSTGDQVFQAPDAAAKDRWRKAGDEKFTNIPVLGRSFEYNYTDIKYQSASWIKLREVVLSYLFTRRSIPRLPVQDLKISVQGRNLWKHVANDAGIDPEAYRLHQGYRTLPLMPSWSFNLQVNF